MCIFRDIGPVLHIRVCSHIKSSIFFEGSLEQMTQKKEAVSQKSGLRIYFDELQKKTLAVQIFML